MITDVGVDAALRIVLGLIHTLHPYYKWKAPEMLVADPMRLKYLREGEEVTWRIADPTKAGDIFSFGRTVHEVSRCSPSRGPPTYDRFAVYSCSNQPRQTSK